jgi:hypothetical protein
MKKAGYKDGVYAGVFFFGRVQSYLLIALSHK